MKPWVWYIAIYIGMIVCLAIYLEILRIPRLLGLFIHEVEYQIFYLMYTEA